MASPPVGDDQSHPGAPIRTASANERTSQSRRDATNVAHRFNGGCRAPPFSPPLSLPGRGTGGEGSPHVTKALRQHTPPVGRATVARDFQSLEPSPFFFFPPASTPTGSSIPAGGQRRATPGTDPQPDPERVASRPFNP